MGKHAMAWGLAVFACSCGGSDGSDLFPPGDDGGEPEAAPLDASGVDAAQDATIEDATTSDATGKDAAADVSGGDATIEAGKDAGADADAGTACTSDKDCAPPATVCDTGTGQCVPNTCPAPNQTCPMNPADECCARPLGNVCVPGNCCTNAQCAAGAPACVGGTCAACEPVGASYQFHVDPNNGSDAASSTGSGTAGGTPNPACALKTITRAIALVPAAAAQILVDVSSTIEAGETFPIPVPANVLVAAAPGQAVTVRVPAGANGFTLATAGSTIANLVVDGQSGLASNGVVAQAGASSFLNDVEVRGFQLAGVRAEAGALTITGGALLRLNGTNQQASPGLRVTGTAAVTIMGGTNQRPTSFSQNQGAGIAIDQNGAIALSGTPGAAPGVGTVVANGNGTSGVTIAQAIGAQPAPVNGIDGLVAFSNGASGITIAGGSGLKLRNSSLLDAKGHGVHVQPATGAILGGDDVSRIDLGDPASSAGYGHNVVQDPNAPNAGVGICLDLSGISVGHTLKAAGNVFGPGLNCATTNATLTKNGCNPNSKGTVGITSLLDAIDATMCQVR